jgi:hypothetical protein
MHTFYNQHSKELTLPFTRILSESRSRLTTDIGRVNGSAI